MYFIGNQDLTIRASGAPRMPLKSGGDKKRVYSSNLNFILSVLLIVKIMLKDARTAW